VFDLVLLRAACGDSGNLCRIFSDDPDEVDDRRLIHIQINSFDKQFKKKSISGSGFMEYDSNIKFLYQLSLNYI